MYRYLIYDQLKKYAGAEKAFHVPGHKAEGQFSDMFPVAPLDVTELSYSDNLFCPAGVIDAAQRDIAKILGAEKSFILTDGSTSGVYAMLKTAAEFGGKIIVPRNCHQSVWNACGLFNLQPIVVQGTNGDAPDCAEIENILKNDGGVAGIIVTSPDYYGTVAPLEEYSVILKKYGRLLIVDGAHGAHLAFEENRRGYAGVYADMWVDGAHKSLPVLTQGAILSVKDADLAKKVEQSVTLFRTTSPSYPIMASVEYGVKFMANNPQTVKNAKDAVAEFVKNSPFPVAKTDDWTKILIDFLNTGVSPERAAAALEKRGIYAELTDGRYVLFYVSANVAKKSLDALNAALCDIKADAACRGGCVVRKRVVAGKRVCDYLSAANGERELVPVSKAEGRVCARNFGITPPCIPVAVAGEEISAQAVQTIKDANAVFGLTDGCVWVLK